VTEVGLLHHVELWVEDVAVAQVEWAWLLGELGYRCVDRWPAGQSWEVRMWCWSPGLRLLPVVTTGCGPG